MQYQEVSQLVIKELQALERDLKQHLYSQNPLISQLSKHLSESRGKRIRPMLVFLCCKLCDYPGDEAVVYAAAVELVHTATLLHDDVIDEATTRRGAASANSKWGNRIPILVGDYLYSISSMLIVDKDQPRIMKIMADTVKAVVEGELLEIYKCRDIKTTEEDYFSVISNKTASLFSLCCQIGGILGKKGKSYEKALAGFGLNLGIAFQLVDDLLDIVSQPEKLGKPVGNDLKEGNLTLPIIHLLQNANPTETKHIRDIIQSDNGNLTDTAYINQLLDRYEGKNYTLQFASRYIKQAKEDLSVFDDSTFSQALLALSDYVIDREF